MKIGISTFGTDGIKSGIGQYLENILIQFSKSSIHECELLDFENKPQYPQELNVFSGYGVSEIFSNPVLNVLWHQMALPEVCVKRKYDVLFLPAANRRLPYSVKCPVVGVIHDFSSIHVKNKYDIFREFYIKRVVPILAKQLDHIITISESTKKDIIQVTGIDESNITIIPQGINHSTYHLKNKDKCKSNVNANHGISDPYILYVSRIENPGKNHIRLIKAFEDLKRKKNIGHKLVLAGSDWTRASEVHSYANYSEYKNDIVFLGFVKNRDLPDLYCASDVFAFPSLYEGFGIPVIEAMASGVPVVCSNNSSLPEISADAAILFNPLSVEDISHSLFQVLDDRKMSNDMVQRGLLNSKKYNWCNTALKTMEVVSGMSKGVSYVL